MKFKKWLYLQESLFLEDFKTQRERFIQQGYQPEIVDRYLDNFRIIKDKKYKQIGDPIHGLEHIPANQRIDIDKYTNFHELEVLVDYVAGQVNIKQAKFSDIECDATPIFTNGNIQIFYADSPQACVKYKGKIPYSWCIARTDSGNMYNTYRYKQHEPTFYFVKNLKRTAEEFKVWNMLKTGFSGKFRDPYHFFVIQAIKGTNPKNHDKKQYFVTSANNDGDKQMSWNEILQIEPELQGLENQFKSVPISPEVRKFYDAYVQGISDQDFAKLEYAKKEQYLDTFITMSKRLTTAQFAVLPYDLKNKYIGFGVGLTDEQYRLISSDKKLVKRYVQITLRKVEELIKNEHSLHMLTPTEVDILFNSGFDFYKLKDNQISEILDCARLQDVYKLAMQIYQNKPNLSQFDINYFSEHTEGDIKAIKFILQKVGRLTDSNVQHMLHYRKNKPADETDDIINMLIQHLIKNNKKFSNNNAADLYKYSTPQNRQKIIGTIFEHTDDLSDTTIGVFMKTTKTPNRMAKMIIQYKKNRRKKLSDDNITSLLAHVPNKERMISWIVKHIKRINEKNISDIMQYAENKETTAMMVLQNKKNNRNLTLEYADVDSMMSKATHPDVMAEIIINYMTETNQKLNHYHIASIINESSDETKIADMIFRHTNERLDNHSIEMLFSCATNKEEMIRVIFKYIKELNNENIYSLTTGVRSKYKTIKMLLKHMKDNEQELSDYAISVFLRCTERQHMDEIIEMIIQQKKELNNNDLEVFIGYAVNKEKIKQLIREKSSSRLHGLRNLPNEIKPFSLDEI